MYSIWLVTKLTSLHIHVSSWDWLKLKKRYIWLDSEITKTSMRNHQSPWKNHQPIHDKSPSPKSMENSPKTYGETSALSFPSSLTLPSTSWNQGLSFFAAASMVSKPRLVSLSLHCNAIECPWLNYQPPHTWQFRSEYVIFGVMSLSNICFFWGWHHVKSPCVSPGCTRSLSLTTTYGQCINMNIHIYIYILYIYYTYLEPKWPLFWLEKALFRGLDLQK